MHTKNYSQFLSVVILTFVACVVFADEDIDKVLDKEQAKLQAEIEHSLVSPCCWNMTVDQHESGTSRQVRLKIADLIKAGKNKEEILDYFVAQPQYGERILATPSQDNWLGKSAYWLIPLFLVFGGSVVIVVIRNLSKSGQAVAPTAEQKMTKGQAASNVYSQRVENELKEFDT